MTVLVVRISLSRSPAPPSTVKFVKLQKASVAVSSPVPIPKFRLLTVLAERENVSLNGPRLHVNDVEMFEL